MIDEKCNTIHRERGAYMRVIAGSARRLQLKTLDGIDTRPTTDRIKETLFNMIAPYIYDCVFLDLFSGSGGIGIEALSRGAKEAVFVENNPKAMACIKENLKFTRLEKKAVTWNRDVMTALHQMEGKKVFDYIFMDPPYNQKLEQGVLEYLSGSSLVYEDTVIIAEASRETDFSYLDDLGFHLLKEKVYKTNKHVFMEKAGKEEIC
ncbi:16S rRNA (guanine(966)-N(2))-methyltransferase RsmD [Schaedlerella arabinosiphila]|jgi:16S rRNA (guanine(966)-N(2))-methyltransferase RsmD|uniref:16S rRNA (Guanine(966)-N(2))-methyltransferase RsmD n=1 Tax=Schaedlerella arabinosiphila TaxID=2044587 RepID=A0A3R8JTN8_9FIRM|nr:16S rRNA (guanine(966)-N(2))-methyltransferase RsmD [Schaedlerella arabinosiphila]MCI9213151.1 16S rRNA (guanine(966)-N(2))-methyltransferase RsmD [Ruminococcus sp.]MCI9603345.1 16S rRNA (guanine(966)-N(2))-methyltransferase RsmD [Ruminococcus sp.]MCI9632434.1 16S rRNA (guanine(966)-N(2))-methyltransferase RsmD [Ruminococcus sp.]NDO71435.1 16S rRNA (guanine(966)-N(2))-methyltransferase RsmD [Schaedlerella arabinosiphila]RRK35302.1 16S rRNA (guanine(966)-N(2))-methyltransferase RsmD [Schaedl